MRRTTASAGLLGLLVALMAVTATTGVTAGSAAAASTARARMTGSSYVTMVSEQGDYIGGGAARIWRAGAGQVSVSGSTSGLVVYVDGGPSGDSFTMDFAAPPGRTLHVGAYDDAERATFRSAGHPGLDISGDGRGCNEVSGSFRVLDLAPDLSRVWLTYEQHCEGGEAALIGEVRLGMPATSSSSLVAAEELDWPAEYPGTSGRIVPVVVANRGDSVVDVAGAEITRGAADFAVAGNTCDQLFPDETCRVYVAFQPSGVGTRWGELAVTVDGRTHRTVLRGDGRDGATSWTMHSEPGDYIGAGKDWSYVPQDSTIVASGNESIVWFSVDSGDDWWDATFEADSGHLLLPGTTFTNATRYPFNSSSTPGLSVSGNGRGCNTLTGSFTVDDADYVDGELVGIQVSFEQHCESMTAALTGTLQWQAGADHSVTRSSLTLGGEPTPGGTTLVGMLRDAVRDQPLGGQVVGVYVRRPGGHWAFRQVLRTGDSGGVSLTVSPHRTRDYRLQYLGAAGHRQQASNVMRVPGS